MPPPTGDAPDDDADLADEAVTGLAVRVRARLFGPPPMGVDPDGWVDGAVVLADSAHNTWIVCAQPSSGALAGRSATFSDPQRFRSALANAVRFAVSRWPHVSAVVAQLGGRVQPCAPNGNCLYNSGICGLMLQLPPGAPSFTPNRYGMIAHRAATALFIEKQAPWNAHLSNEDRASSIATARACDFAGLADEIHVRAFAIANRRYVVALNWLGRRRDASGAPDVHHGGAAVFPPDASWVGAGAVPYLACADVAALAAWLEGRAPLTQPGVTSFPALFGPALLPGTHFNHARPIVLRFDGANHFDAVFLPAPGAALEDAAAVGAPDDAAPAVVPRAPPPPPPPRPPPASPGGGGDGVRRAWSTFAVPADFLGGPSLPTAFPAPCHRPGCPSHRKHQVFKATGYQAHGRWHAAQEDAARRAVLDAPMADVGDDGGPSAAAVSLALPTAGLDPSKFSELSAVDLREAHRPGSARAQQWIPRHALPLARAAYNRVLSATVTPDGRLDPGGVTALALFATDVLGVDRRSGAAAGQRQTRQLERQLRAFADGRFGELRRAAEARAARNEAATLAGAAPPGCGAGTSSNQPQPPSPSPTPAVPTLAHRARRRAQQLARQGELRRACDALTPSEAAPAEEATFEVLRALHPAPLRPISDELLARVVEHPLQATAATLRAVLTSLRRLVAPGPSLLTNDHLLQLFPPDTTSDEELLPLVQFVNCVLAGAVDDGACDFLSASSLSALIKTDAAGQRKWFDEERKLVDLRPLAVPETLWRLISLCALQLVRQSAAKHLAAAQQLGVGVPGACEGIAEAVRLYLLDPLAADADGQLSRCRVALSMDATNAFNCIDRATIFEECARTLPELLPLLRVAYARPGRLTYSRRATGRQSVFTLLSRAGVRQGDPLAPLLFCLAWAVVLRNTKARVPGADLPSYADDVTLLGVPSVAGAAAVALCEEAQAQGVRMNPAKCLSYCATRSAADLALPPCVTPSPNGAATLGVPVGTHPYVTTYVRQKLAPALQAMELLPQLGDTQSAIRMLCCSILPRPRYLASTLGLADLAEVFPEWDAAVRRCVAGLYAGQTPPRCFASGAGCLGLPPMADEHAQNRFNGFLRGSELIRQYMTAENGYCSGVAALAVATHDSLHPVHLAVRVAWDALPAVARAKAMETAELTGSGDKIELLQTLAGTKALNVRNSITKAANEHRRSELLLSLEPLQQLLMRQSSAPHARGAIDSDGRFATTRLTDDEAKIGHLLWLGAELPVLRGTPYEGHGRGLLSLNNSDTHDALRDALFAAMAPAGLRAVLEVVGLFGARPGAPPGSTTGTQRRMDLVAWSGLLRILIDVTKVNGATPDILAVSDAVARPLAGVIAAERSKFAHYPDPPDGWRMLPVAIGSQGELAPLAAELLHLLATRTARRQAGGEEPTSTAIARELRVLARRLMVELMRGQARQILTFVDGSVPAAVQATIRAQRGYLRDRAAPAGRHRGRRPGWGPAPFACVCDAPTCLCGAQRASRPLPSDHPAHAAAAAGAAPAAAAAAGTTAP